jgi:solute carrier family 25 carnitine/acylcarnitine transporter 20/29
MSFGHLGPGYAMGVGAAGQRLIFSIYPIDVIKSKIQTDALDPTKRQYKGMIDCVRKTWSKEGWKGFTGGLGPTLIR